MTLHGVGQCALFVHSFNYIALPTQGFCHFRLSLVQDQPLFHAQPYALHSVNRARAGHTPSQLLDSEGEYCSPSFYLMHSNDEVVIQDMCLFRLDLPLGKRFQSKEVVLWARLFFLESASEATKSSQENSLEHYSLIATGSLLLRISESGLHECFPLIFEHTNLVVCRLAVHVACIDYRVSVPEELASVSAAQAFAKLVFGDLAYREELEKVEIERTYHACVRNLRLTHEQMRTVLAALQVTAAAQSSNSPALPSDSVPYQRTSLPPPLHLPLLVKIGPSIMDSSEVSSGIFLFSDQLASWQPEKVASSLIKEIHEISLTLTSTFDLLLDWYKRSANLCFDHFYAVFFEQISLRYADFFFRETHTVETVPLRYQENVQQLHSEVSSVRRKSNFSSMLNPSPIHAPIFHASPEAMPIIFEDRYSSTDSPTRLLTPVKASLSTGDMHVFVLVHGLGARAGDMGRLADHIYLLHPDAVVLMSAYNEGLTDGDILEMGNRLAQEVLYFVKNLCQIEDSMKRLSFIGHSLGGLIIRAALPLLSEYEDKMHLYLSLSTPHLGCMYSTSKLVAAGMWLYSKKWLSIQQMALKDHSDLTNCALYRLSGYEGLKWFAHVVLCSSPQDQYAPYCSARLEVSDKALRDGKRGCLHMEMAVRVLEGIEIRRLRRLDVSFQAGKKDISSAIGRSAHVDILQNEMVIKLLLFRYPELFL